MSVTTKQVHDAIWAELSGDATLTAYVRQWVRGTGLLAGFATSFPYVEFNVLRWTSEPLTVGPRGVDRIEYTCAVDILLSDLSIEALFSGDSVQPGIYQFIDDTIAAIQYKKFGVLTEPSMVSAGDVTIDRGDHFIVGASLDLTCVVHNRREICG